MIRKWLFLISITVPLLGQSIRIANIDNSALLTQQKIRLYVNVLDDNGELIKGVTAERFSVQESPDGNRFSPVRGVVEIIPQTNYVDGINLLLLIDNSGSMYRTIDGEETDEADAMRITWVRHAVNDLLSSITNPNDKVGLVSYNSFYTSHTQPTTDKGIISQLLDKIEKPIGDARFTELYSSLYLAIDEFRNTRGRKVIILLSDGENGAYYPNTGKLHPQLGDKVYTYNEPIAYAQQEGISLFAINFGKQGEFGDRNLTQLATSTGGERFDAHNESELKGIYRSIMEQILNEYAVNYTANMDPSDRRWVRLIYRGDNQTVDVTRFYFAGTILGQPLPKFPYLLLLPLIVALGGLYLLSLAKFDKRNALASLEVLKTRVGSISTRIVTLQGDRTVIGRSADADMTIVGDPQIRENHATIIFDEKKDTYTIVSDTDIVVNNKPTTTRILEAGDVINIGGTLTVFDEGLKD